MNLSKFVLFIIMVLVIKGCNSNDNNSNDNAGEMQTAVIADQVKYGGLTVYLDSALWVNDMPQAYDPNSLPDKIEGNFIASVKLKSIEGPTPLSTITKVKLYIVINEEIQWQSEATDELSSLASDSSLNVIFRNGPGNLRQKIVDVVIVFNYLGEEILINQQGLFVTSAT